ncbi:MAG: hypothetical protein V4819_06625 [Verrucomicrobiota bacterium]
MKKSPLAPLRTASCIAACLVSGIITANAAGSGVDVIEKDGQVRVTWPISADEAGSAVFSMDEAKPLIESLGVAAKGKKAKVIASGLTPVTLLTVGSRDLANPAGWVAFFDNPPKRPHETFPVKLGKRSLRVSEEGSHTTVSLAEASAGSFHGELRFTFYRNSGLMKAETVMATEEDGRAIVYDTGLAGAKPDWTAVVWKDTAGKLQRAAIDPDFTAIPLAVQGRTIVAEGAGGSLAVFPAPHRFFYPQDEAFNLKFVWHGKDYGGTNSGCGIGIRQSLEGDKRYTPWFNAPPKTRQELGAFYLISSGDGKQTLDAVAKYTRGDRYQPLPGHKTFTSHYHVEHTLEYLRKQKEQKAPGVPAGLETPGMVKTFKERGVNIVHLAEFHIGDTPKMNNEQRLPLLKTLHLECNRLSDDDLLMLPGEEPNVHLGGHWISLFPKPVYWVLNRPAEAPFVEDTEAYGKVYHVGSQEDVLKLMELENGLMWTAHARIKASIGFPDKYRSRSFFDSERFLGAAWKAMPADLSRPTLGWRVLDLLDDMSNWGMRKHVIGEADLFRMEPEFETYAHMNINYLKLDKLPKFNAGWQPVLDSLRGGSFFTTSGEILIPNFTVGGKSSGEVIDDASGEQVVEADLEWTFPMAFANIVSGDGKQVFHQRVELGDTGSFGKQKLRIPVNLKGRTWVRFEAWDIATNGAFTQPVWIGPKLKADFSAEMRGFPIPKEQLTAGFTEVVPTAATQPAVWRWTKAEPAKDWAQPGFKDADWLEGKSAFGTATTPGTDGILNTTWNTKDIWIRREVTLPQELGSKLRLRIHHDNMAEVYIDGILAWSAVDIETRDYQIFEISPEAMARLKPGAKILLAAHGHNGVGGQVLDVGLVNLK